MLMDLSAHSLEAVGTWAARIIGVAEAPTVIVVVMGPLGVEEAAMGLQEEEDTVLAADVGAMVRHRGERMDLAVR